MYGHPWKNVLLVLRYVEIMDVYVSIYFSSINTIISILDVQITFAIDTRIAIYNIY